jgi:hypothetical protein
VLFLRDRTALTAISALVEVERGRNGSAALDRVAAASGLRRHRRCHRTAPERQAILSPASHAIHRPFDSNARRETWWETRSCGVTIVTTTDETGQ